MSMKKLCVPALALILALTALAACGFAPADGEALATGNEHYICVSPSDDVLAGEEYSLSSELVAEGNAESFRLQQSYYYKVSQYGKIFVLEDERLSSFGYYLEDVPEEMLLDSLPDGVTEENARPSAVLTVKEGETLTLANGIDSSEYTLYYLGVSDDDPAEAVFFADSETSNPICDSAPLSVFEPFAVSWHPVAEARRDELLAPPETPDVPEEPADDLTGGEPSDALRIILIIGIAVPALLIVFLLFKPVAEKRGYDRRKVMRRDPDRAVDYDRERSYDRDRYDRGYRDYERDDREYRDYDRREDRRDRDYRDRY